MATIEDMIKKRIRRADSTESSSYEEMEPSRPPKDVLGLGQYLVRELGFEDRVDTLGRWMTHYLAELMDEAENGSTIAKRNKARKEASATILKIWDHRTSLPGKAYPLSPYMDLLRKIDMLQVNNNPFRFFTQDATNKKERLAAELFDGLSRLIISLLQMETVFEEKSAENNPATIEALNETEKRLLTALQKWGNLSESPTDSAGRKRTGKKDKKIPKIDLGEAALQLIDGITITLDKLKEELQGSD